ncbi:MAG TPA: phosphoglucomutase (alpha-D-glucose-1,6-bisphosphate-dependent) [Candidatus Desulfovibrio intestinipullorum]|uniref:Phosphoglucomutase (Alpha-D-glucose-1,6-bisphosphate-dependent) n=1 Tax=Candidatus Desulfovibrio intestinipullorum TaxID=2838536 RepID=A0A9D1PVL1_9BACT|nr:phosphoglucomutase (alpha-D-glucose-1,6-bisphosphate-dependent) [Candidatus Desulfovibrio intestinipullorum]
MAIHELAGQLPDPTTLENIPALISAYYTLTPDAANAGQRVSFGTSGHRGSALKRTFNEAHILAITQAVCELRAKDGIEGPLYLGADTHALSEPAQRTALEVLVANNVHVRVAKGGAFTATPAVSHAILLWNREHTGSERADGIIITPSHNPPADGGFKYNPPHGGPADTSETSKVEQRANELLAAGNVDVKRVPYAEALTSPLVEEYDYVAAYVDHLGEILDMEAIAKSGLRLGVDPLGGASLSLWQPIADKYGLNLTVVNRCVDPTFRFVPRDKDGKIRMDCSSPWAMSVLLNMRDKFDLCFACDPDSDRHGIVTADGLMNPNHYLSVCAWYLLRTRTGWPEGCGIGKTVVTTDMLNRVGDMLQRKVVETPVGFKWFVPLLSSGECGFCCEESAGGSFLCFDGSTWSTDKDGPLLCLLAAEMMAKEQASPSELYRRLTAELGVPVYQRLDSPADTATRSRVKALTADDVALKDLGGSPVTQVLTHAPGNNAAIGGLKVVSKDGWFAVRPSGTEDICKLYTESFRDEDHLKAIQAAAQDFLAKLLK